MVPRPVNGNLRYSLVAGIERCQVLLVRVVQRLLRHHAVLFHLKRSVI